MTNIVNNKKIAKNTALLYIRMLVIMLINLYTVRLVLNALGQEDYGIFNVVAGFVSLLQSISFVFSTATQRFYSYSMGENDNNKLSQVFSCSTNIYLFFSIIIILLGETLGCWFLNSCLVIPDNRIFAANILYQFSLLTFIATLLQSPFSSAVIANEDMGVFAIVSLADCLLRFISAILLSLFLYDKLIVYGITLFCIPVVILIAYAIYARRKYPECHYHRIKDNPIRKEIFSFSGWTFFSSFAGVGMNQVLTILINMFFGPIANAARAIAVQVSGAINAFSSSFIMAITPPMIKSYANEQFDELNKLFNLGNKFIFYCLMILCIPLFFEMETVIGLWLKTKDQQTILFSQLIIIYSVILALNNPISIIIQASGKMKEYNIPVEVFTLLCPFLTLLLFYLGFDAYYSFIAMIFCILCSHVVRVIMIKRLYECFNTKNYLLNFILPAILITILSTLFVYFTRELIDNPYIRLIYVACANSILMFFLVYLIGLNKNERNLIIQMLKQKKHNGRFK